ncbi:MAG: pilus assembly protein PilP [Rhodocyclaceae bacterium]|nr:pilus assembly protein PilP [Rhodocyclaceae bacterium]
MNGGERKFPFLSVGRFKWIALTSVLLTGCGGDELHDLREFVKNAGVDLLGKIPTAPNVKLYEPFIYDNKTGLPDPFKPRKHSVGPRRANEPDFNRPKEVLEEFPLESLKMVGYLQQHKVGYAVVRTTDGNLHRVKIGNYMGMNFGLIRQVSDTEVTIKEMVQDSTGDWSERISSLQLVE